MFWTVTLCITLVVLLLGYCHYRHQYWQSRGVFVPPSAPIIGHVFYFFLKKENFHEYLRKMFLKTRSPLIGTYEFLKPNLSVGDVTLAKHILVKDFDHFVDRRHFDLKGSVDEVFHETLTNLTGEEWKALRSIVSPTFTSGKLRGLFPLISEKCQRLSRWCLTEGTRREKVEMKELFGRFTLEAIATAAFGIESHCIENEEDEFFKAALQVSRPISFMRLMKTLAFLLVPRLFTLLKIKIADSSVEYFETSLRKTLERRKTADRRGDFLDLMLDAKKEYEAGSQKNKYPVTDNTVMAQSILFLFAGFETTSTTLAFFSYVLARHPEVQEQVREELKGLLNAHGEITYQTIAEAKFLDACLHEALRLYPPATHLERMCTKDYTLPGTDITLKKKMLVGIPVWTMNRDPEIWEDPETFKPERFLVENRTPDQTFAFQSFGQGPRNCVGMRFALLEVKLAIAHLVLNLELQLAPGYEGPLEFKVHIGTLTAKDGINLAFRTLREDSRKESEV